MALTTLVAGTEAKVSDLNNNFEYLDGRITTTNTTVSNHTSQLSSLSISVGTLTSSVESLGTNKANKNGDNITADFANNLVSSYGSKFKQLPDYAHPNADGVNPKVANTEYTAPCDGWVRTSLTGQRSTNHLYINTEDMVSFYHDDDENKGANWTGLTPVSKGDKYKCTSAPVFYPVKGVY